MEDREIEEGMVVEKSSQLPAPSRKLEKSPYDMLKKGKASVEEIVAKILSIKKENKTKSELREHVTQMFLCFVTLRQANRSILLEEDKVKVETERAKALVDFTTLQLHNLMYEKSHYLKAKKTCKDFKSKYPDIELVSKEEFFHDAPEEIKGSNLSDDSSHNLMLKRLNYELFQRKELCKLLEKLEQRKKSLLETIANRKKFLSSLPSHLKSLKKASLPFMGQKEAFGEDIDLEIVGSMKDAQAFARQQANKDNGLSTSVESSRLEDDVPDEEDDGQRRRKRPKRVPSEVIEQAGIYQVHPLKIILHINDDETSDPRSKKLITLKFEYLLKLNVVCVGIEGSTDGPEYNILCNLFPDDTGLDLPHQSAKLFVGDAATFDEKRTSRPYKWAQHLAGIDFLPEVSPLLNSHETLNNETKSDAVISGLAFFRQQNRVQTVVQRICSRKKAELARDPKSMRLCLKLLLTQNRFKNLWMEDLGSSLDHSKQLALISKSIWCPVKISMECPIRPPLFTVNLYSSGENSSENDYSEWHNEVRAMEAEVNLHMLKMVPPDEENYTLSHQVYCLAMLFDYYTGEAIPSSEKRKSSSVIDVGLCKPVSVRLLARSLRGRDPRKMVSWKDMECTTGNPF
ncbi:hypothetical protein CRYUN_Cryun27aG0082200 [Craigia yunnanensis]